MAGMDGIDTERRGRDRQERSGMYRNGSDRIGRSGKSHLETTDVVGFKYTHRRLGLAR